MLDNKRLYLNKKWMAYQIKSCSHQKNARVGQVIDNSFRFPVANLDGFGDAF